MHFFTSSQAMLMFLVLGPKNSLGFWNWFSVKCLTLTFWGLGTLFENQAKVPLWCSGLRIQCCLHLQLRFAPWPRNFILLQVWQKKKKKKKESGDCFGYFFAKCTYTNIFVMFSEITLPPEAHPCRSGLEIPSPGHHAMFKYTGSKSK